MGLLDDAIREHLELKRLKGADPGQVAREEHEALGQVGRMADEGDVIYQEPASEEEGPLAQGLDLPGHASAHGQETVELDMDSVLHEDHATTPGSSASQPKQHDAGDVSSPDPQAQGLSAEDSLEWEMTGDHDQSPDEGDDRDDADHHEEQMEDMLEETPDFLRETPEQDRLWFEQRPPRDFDFNE